MIYGRNEEIAKLNENMSSDKNTFTVLYGRTGIGKTTLIKEFIKGKNVFYYSAAQASEKEQIELLKHTMISEGLIESEKEGEASSQDVGEDSFKSLFYNFKNIDSDIKIVIIEEFQNIVKGSKEFVAALESLVSGELFGERLMLIVTGSSISWTENNMVSSLGKLALSITSFVKLRELQFVDIVRMFPKYSVRDCMIIFAITGGVPGYISYFSDSISLKDNICRQIIRQGAPLRTEGSDFIREELRETSLYNTIIHCIACGENKLNELHAHTGFGRDKISVYLKNLMEREIVEKVYSYDTSGKEYTKKGLYRIKAGFTEFWFRYIYGFESQINMMTPEDFYSKYIEETLYDFASETFVKVGTEFVELLASMGKLEININRIGRWWGKNGNIDIVISDENGKYLVGKCSWGTDVFTFAMFEELLLNINLAGIGKDYIYLFSRDSFDRELKMFAHDNDNVKLISLNEL